jgi:putative resolvase
MKQKIKLSQWAKMNGYSYHGAFRLFKLNKIPNAIQTNTGTILVEIENETVSDDDYTVIYARVSSAENKDNLDTQVDRLKNYCIANGLQINEIIKECASGMNDHRPKLQKILTNGKTTRIVVEHKDRLTRFGFNYIKILFPGEIVVVNMVDEKDQDMMQDFISVITSFCARIYGHRRSKRKTDNIIRELENE